jgi:chromobox protein 1
MTRSRIGHGNRRRTWCTARPHCPRYRPALTVCLSENASEALNEYLEGIGGRDKLFEDSANALKNKKRARPSSSTPQASGKRTKRNGEHPAESDAPLSARAATWKPPPGSWEDHIANLDACEDEESGKLMVYLSWKNGQKTQHTTNVIYQRCPQKVCRISHIIIISQSRRLTHARCCNSTSGM